MRTTKRQSRDEEPTIDDMRYDLAELEAMNMGVSQIIDFLLDGCEGLYEASDFDIREEWERVFGVDKD